MIVELFPFQRRACTDLRVKIADALQAYHLRNVPQVISFTAPTGAGKTIIMASLIEDIFCGVDNYLDQPEAIFVWLSDSPQLNEQSKIKIETKADRIRIGQCVTIEDESFDQEMLNDGKIYFLNTQKLGRASNLTRHSDSRQYTIWETIANTMREKSDRLYFIIDEAHRGAQGRDATTATTIMQKFILGSEDDGIPPMPLVIGMSATMQRFNALVGDTSSSIQKCVVNVEDVRSSGLLKDRIVITYPESTAIGNEMAVLEAAADEWKDKWEHWFQYCSEQKHSHVYPIFVVQVLNGNDNVISFTNLNDCLSKIEERTGFRFRMGEVVHTFGQTSQALMVNGLDVRYVEPSQITDDRNIKVVFFKENLSTGWDCPRAETMMSFRHAADVTYIAQLLGRMVRTPMQMHIEVDESLNDVHLYLPHFDENTVRQVVDALQNSEGGNIAEIVPDSMEDSTIETWTTGATNNITIQQEEENEEEDVEPSTIEETQEDEEDDMQGGESNGPAPPVEETPNGGTSGTSTATIPTATTPTSETPTISTPTTPQNTPITPPSAPTPTDDINRDGILNYINGLGLLSYKVRKVTTSNYLKSLYKLVHLLVHSELCTTAIDEVHNEITDKINQYVQELRDTGQYDDLSTQVRLFELNSQIFDAFGQSIDSHHEHSLYSTTDVDIERQFNAAESRLGSDGVGYTYGNRYGDVLNPTEFMIDVILFATDAHNLEKLEEYAKGRFHSLVDQYRRRFATIESERVRKQYDDIVSAGDLVSRHNFRIPETVRSLCHQDGKEYSDHLLVNPATGRAKISLNTWEEATLREEQQREGYICWLRNPSRGKWSLCIPYEYNGEIKATYPDLIIVRRDGEGYVIDILEPHRPDLDDNLGKAQGFAEYARRNTIIGKIELIRMLPDTIGRARLCRLDLSMSAIRDKVSRATTPEELNHLFETDGFFAD